MDNAYTTQNQTWLAGRSLWTQFNRAVGEEVSHRFETMGEAEIISHGLSAVPTGWLVIRQDAPGSVYALDADVALWTNATIAVRSDAPGMTVTIRILR